MDPAVVNEPPWHVSDDKPALPDSPRGGAGASLGGPASTTGVKPPKKGDEGQAVLASLIFFLIAITTGIGFYFFQKGGLPFNLGKKAAGGCCTYGGSPTGCAANESCVNDQAAATAAGCTYPYVCKTIVLTPTSSPIVPTSPPSPTIPQSEQYPEGCCSNSQLGNYRSCPGGQVCNIPNGACGPGGKSCNPVGSGYHKACVGDQCVNVPGGGVDGCISHSECKVVVPTSLPSPTIPQSEQYPEGCCSNSQLGDYRSCKDSQVCNIPNGACGPDGKSCNPSFSSEFHKDWVNGQCVNVPGSGGDRCGLPTPTLKPSTPTPKTIAPTQTLIPTLRATPTPYGRLTPTLIPLGGKCSTHEQCGGYKGCGSTVCDGICKRYICDVGVCGRPRDTGYTEYHACQMGLHAPPDNRFCCPPTEANCNSYCSRTSLTPTLTSAPIPTAYPTPASISWTGKYCKPNPKAICTISIPPRCSGCANCVDNSFWKGFARCLDVIPTPVPYVPGGNFPTSVLTSAPIPTPAYPTPASISWTGKYCHSGMSICTISIPPRCSGCSNCVDNSDWKGFARCLDIIPTPVPGGHFPSPVLTSAPISVPTVTPTPVPRGWSGKYCQSKAVCTLSIPPICSPCTSCSGFFGFARCLDVIPTPASP